MDEKTCGNCEDVSFEGYETFAVAGCKITGYVVPHLCEYKEKRLTFWRVPMECPRSSGVIKSEKQAPKKDWIIKSFSDFK